MDALLSPAFNNICSNEPTKIGKGLRQIEGLLAQIALAERPNGGSSTNAKPLDSLPHDPAYREFFWLQESFEWNVATKLIDCLSRLLGKSSSPAVDALIKSTLDNVLGVFLLHPPSRSLFGHENTMTLLVDLLVPKSDQSVLLVSVDVLSACLLDSSRNTRVFEGVDGVRTVSILYQSAATSAETKRRIEDFFEVYLRPERADSLNDCSEGPRAKDKKMLSPADTRSADEKMANLKASLRHSSAQ